MSEESNSSAPGTSSTSGVFCDTSNPTENDLDVSSDSSIWEFSSSDTDTDFFLPQPAPLTYANSEYVRQLETDLRITQKAFMSISTQHTRLKFKLRKIFAADAEERENMLQQLEASILPMDEDDGDTVLDVPCNNATEVQQKQSEIIQQLRQQLEQLTVASQQKYCIPSQLINERKNIEAAKEQLLQKLLKK